MKPPVAALNRCQTWRYLAFTITANESSLPLAPRDRLFRVTERPVSLRRLARDIAPGKVVRLGRPMAFVWLLYSPECGLPAFWRTQRQLIDNLADH